MLSFPSFSAQPSKLDRLTSIASTASSGLTPVVVINRRVDTALRNLDGEQDSPFSTVHTSPSVGPAGDARRASRLLVEKMRGTYGDGADAGHTVFGSVRFVPTEDVAAGAQSVLAALDRQGDVGARAYGPVSFVADPAKVMPRTTVAADDTGATLTRVRDVADLPRVIAERLRRSDGRPDAPSVEQLLSLPHTSASDTVRGWLLSDSLAGSDDYIEAQIRRVAPSDLLGAVIDVRTDERVARRVTIDPGATPSASHVDALTAALDMQHLPHRIKTA